MKVGMNLLLWTDCPTASIHEPIVRSLQEWGYDGIEFPLGGMSRADLRYFAELCDELGLGRTTILALDATVADPASSDGKLRQSAVEIIRRSVDQTLELGANVLSGPLFQGLGRFSGNAPTAEEWERSAEVLRAAGEYAADAGVRLALEPINRFEMYLVNTLEQATRFVDLIGLPNVGLLADTHHGNIEETNTAEAWRAAGHHIFHVHLSENDRGAPGSGQAISPAIFEVLQEIGYTGWLTVEAFGQGVPGLIPRLHLWRAYAPGEEELAKQGLSFIRSQLGLAMRIR